MWHAVSVETDEVALAGELAALIASARHPMEASRTQSYTVRRHERGLAVSEEGDALALVTSAGEACELIHERSHRRAFELAALKGWRMLRGALVDIDGRRLLLLGAPGVGKTIVTLRLGLAGAAIQGDDRVLVRDGEVFALPRPLALPDDAAALIPAPGRLERALPQRGRATLIDPLRDLGLPWNLRIAPIVHIVELVRGPAQEAATACAPLELLAPLGAALGPADQLSPELLALCAQLLRAATAHRLSVGDPATAELALRALAC